MHIVQRRGGAGREKEREGEREGLRLPPMIPQIQLEKPLAVRSGHLFNSFLLNELMPKLVMFSTPELTLRFPSKRNYFARLELFLLCLKPQIEA